MSENEFIDFIEKIPGFCFPQDCFMLYTLVSGLQCPGDVLEIGAFKGRTAVALAKGLVDGQKEGMVYSVEANLLNTRDELLCNIDASGAKDRVKVIFMDSARANIGWQAPLKFIWIDGDGNYLTTKADFILWERHLLPGGAIGFGGVSNPDIQRAIKKYIIDSGRFSGITFSKELCIAVKDREAVQATPLRIGYVRCLYRVYMLVKLAFYRSGMNIPAPLGGRRLKALINKIFERFL